MCKVLNSKIIKLYTMDPTSYKESLCESYQLHASYNVFSACFAPARIGGQVAATKPQLHTRKPARPAAWCPQTFARMGMAQEGESLAAMRYRDLGSAALSKDQVEQLLALTCGEGARASTSRRIATVPLRVASVLCQDGVDSTNRRGSAVLLLDFLDDVLALRAGGPHAHDLPTNKWIQTREAAL